MKKFFLLVIMVFSSITFLSAQEAKKEDNICVVFSLTEGVNHDRHKYINRFYETYRQLRENGNYRGDVCVAIVEESLEKKIKKWVRVTGLKNKGNLIIKRFNPIGHTERHKNNSLFDFKCYGFVQKLHLFDQYFKRWDYIFYMDIGMQIYSDIKRIINIRKKGKIVAHSNCHQAKWEIPNHWNHFHEFIDDGSPEYEELVSTYNLACDNFQSTVMLYDTTIIEEGTKGDLITLMNQYPMGISDQSWISLYFIHIKPRWEKIPLGDEQSFYYDFFQRYRGRPYIMVKYPRDTTSFPHFSIEW